MRTPEDNVIFNGKSLSDFDVYTSGDGTYVTPERDIEVVEVPGLSGDLVMDNGRFKNKEIKYSAWIVDDDDNGNFEANISGLINFLAKDTNYHVLKDTYHPDEFRYAYFKSPLDPSGIILHKAATFDLTFVAKPFKYLDSGNRFEGVQNGSVLFNPTMFNSNPIIRVSGTGTVSFNGYVITVRTSPTGITDIDCDALDCTSGNTNCNPYVSFGNDYKPSLKPGKNVISISGFNSVSFKTRWKRI